MCGHDGFIRLFGGFLGAPIVNENEAGRVRSEHQVVANHVSVDDVVLVQDVKGHGDVTDEPQELVMPHKWPRNCVEPRVQGAALDFVPAKEGVQHRHGRKPAAAVGVSIQARRKASFGLTNHIIRFLAALVHRKDEVGLTRIV